MVTIGREACHPATPSVGIPIGVLLGVYNVLLLTYLM